MYSLWRDLSIYTKIFDLVTVTFDLHTSIWKFNMSTFEPLEVFHISYFHSLWWGLSVSTKIVDSVTFTMTFDLHIWNIRHNFWTICGRTFIFQISCDEAYQKIWHSDFDRHLYMSENFNICPNLLTIRGRAFIFNMYIPCDETFPFIPNFFTFVTVTFDLHIWKREQINFTD